ncbi:MAG: hypothetical protein J7L43_01100, partial [Candidatus Aenigmarchaeota archaeon]|nr:hypothetical protein [Candidatus Aenigmarchaeota archaeon]
AIEKRVYLRKRAWEYYFGKLSTIPDTRHYKVINVVTKEYIGNLDESFVAEYCTPENSFVFKGSTWRVVQTVDDKVFVEPTTDIESAIPSWQGELIPVHYGVTSDVGRLMKEILENKEIEEVSGDYDSVKKLIKKQSKFFIPGPHEIWIEHNKDFIIIHSFFGSLINETLGMYISSFLTSKYGTSVKMKTNPYSIIIKSLGKPEDIVKILHQPRNLRSMIIQSLEESNLFKWRFIQVAKRFGVMERNVSWNDVNINKIISYYRGMPVYDETIREIFTDKLDLENTRKILEKIKKGEINFFISRKKLSPLGRNSLLYQFSGYLTPKEPKEEIFKFFKRRLLNKTIMIVCMNCYDFKLTTRVKDVEETPECPLCGSRLIGVATRDFDEIEKILRKMKRKGKLNRRERKMYEELRKSANLVITYGHKAIMTLAAHGVGPEQAARILAKIPKNEEELLKLIFKAEKTFIRTHKYWR